MRVMGIDPSLTSTGVFLFDTRNPAQYGLAGTVSVDCTGPARLAAMGEAIEKYVKGLKPEVVALEGHAFMGVGRGRDLGELQGVYRYLLYQLGVKLTVVQPASSKKFLIGGQSVKKGEKKAAVASAIRKIYGWRLVGDDIYDAACVAVIGGALFDPRAPMYRIMKPWQREVIHVLHKSGNLGQGGRT